MSRIGNRVLEVPEGLTVAVGEDSILVSGGGNSISIPYSRFFVKPIIEDKKFMTQKVNNSKQSRSQYGTINALVLNAFVGLTKGFSKSLEIVGVGYKAAVEGSRIRLDLGYSHPIFVDIPADIKVKPVSSLELELTSYNRQSLGEFASKIRGFRPPEPYKGKGIKYKGEVILRKVGKTSEGSKK
ncbi:ribosomal protein L6 [Mycoplasma haemofelis str. Langford 1]|uniref:50S ribosomal protein L6 n=1 Tax=Mycoplasma haemofelis (strain Langford 1) TaxID=941640 RepID=E8ZJY4_MYCHL|nr:50S ribosomal protein L6 [Mycoplasma haemofelis]CBY93455.1 ribosomal protein L6 [Mycoplasma haemofelis str. Langford 1]